MPIQSPFGPPPGAPAPRRTTTPNPQAAAQKAKDKNNNSLIKAVVIMGALIISLAAIGGIIYGLRHLVKKGGENYSARYVKDEIKPKYIRVLPDNAPEVPVAEIFSERNFSLYKQGAGRMLELEMRDKQTNQVVWNAVLDLKPLPIDDFKNLPKRIREKQIEAKKAELEKLVTTFGGTPPTMGRTFAVLFDDTVGGAEKLLPMLTEKFESLGVKERVDLGDSVTIFFHKLTSKYFYNGTKIVIAPHKYNESAQEINDALEKVTTLPETSGRKRHLDRPQSSELAAGIANFLRQDGVGPNTTVLILSDGLENTSRISLEEDEPMGSLRDLIKQVAKDGDDESAKNLLAKKVQDVQERMTEKIEIPDGKGTRLIWWLPPRSSKMEQMRTAVEKLWIPLLAEKNYKAEAFF